MFDALVERCRQEEVKELRGYYYPTAKNKMVKDFYQERGFEKIEEDAEGNTIWRYIITDTYEKDIDNIFNVGKFTDYYNSNGYQNQADRHRSDYIAVHHVIQNTEKSPENDTVNILFIQKCIKDGHAENQIRSISMNIDYIQQ